MNTVRTWNTAQNREAMKAASSTVYHDRKNAAGKDYEAAHKAWQDYCAEVDAIDLLALPELEVLSWAVSAALFDGFGHPHTGIYTEPHKHRYEVCGHVEECVWPERGEPCQAYEHHGERCVPCSIRWWEEYGKAENEAYMRNNPPSWVHDHEEGEPCLRLKCRNFGKPFGISWNNIKHQFEGEEA